MKNPRIKIFKSESPFEVANSANSWIIENSFKIIEISTTINEQSTIIVVIYENDQSPSPRKMPLSHGEVKDM